MTLTETEKLNRIVARCRENLALAGNHLKTATGDYRELLLQAISGWKTTIAEIERLQRCTAADAMRIGDVEMQQAILSAWPDETP